MTRLLSRRAAPWLGALALAATLAAPATVAAQAPARPAAKAPQAAVAKRAPAAPAATVLPAANAEQLAASALAHLGEYACEFRQKLHVAAHALHAGYLAVRLGTQAWTMRPVLSSTGALRLEDVGGRMLMLQIASKSMLMDTRSGRRIVDECVHAAHLPAAAAGGIGIATAAAPAPGATLKLRLLETTDVHVTLLDHDYYQDRPTEEYGLVRTATLIKAARAEARNTLLFDNGDLLQGSPLGDYMARVKPLAEGQVHPAHKLMRALGYDAANVGNHEFNYGLDFVRRAVGGAGFPYVNANLFVDEGGAPPATPAGMKNLFTPYAVLERTFVDEAGATHRLKIGVIGFAPPQVMRWDRSNLLGKVVARDIVETAAFFVPRMKADGADVIVAIAHSGFERGETVFFAENAVAKLAEVPGIDAILFGHSHGEFPGRFFGSHPKVDLERGTINGVPAVMAGSWGSHLGVVDLVLRREEDRWKVADGRAHLRPIFDRATRKALVARDAELAALIREEHEGTLAYVNSPVARSTVPIHSYFAQVADDPSVQLVNQAQMAYAKRALVGTPYESLPLLSASAPLKTGYRANWTNYTDVPAGPVVVRHLADLYPYPNTVKVVRATGAQLREWLEFSAGAFNRIDPSGPPEQLLLNQGFPAYNFDVIDGVSYRIDVTQPARYERSGRLVAPEARRILDLRFEGRPVTDEMVFAVVTNNYRASGGGNFPGLDGSTIVLDAPDESRQAVIDYLRAAQTVTPRADDNWSLLPVPGVKLRFTSGAKAIAHLPAYPRIRLVQQPGDGSALFELNP